MNPGNLRLVELNKSMFHKRLSEWMDYAGVRHWSFINTQVSKGKFRPSAARIARVSDLIREHVGPVIVLGKQNVKFYSHLRIFEAPHPSGLNRKLNDAKYVADFLGRLRSHINSSEHWC